MFQSAPVERRRLVERGLLLEYFTILWNSLEALAALISGFVAGSVALVGFGLDSLIEVTSGAALLWRLHHDEDIRRREDWPPSCCWVGHGKPGRGGRR